MIADYFIWQYRLAPRWLLGLFWNTQRFLYQFFSVPLMVRTLFAHWHRDAAAYRLAGLQSIFITFAWNQISRAIGFIIRFCVLGIYLVLAAVAGIFSLLVFIIFILWPVLLAALIVVGIVLLVQGAWYV